MSRTSHRQLLRGRAAGPVGPLARVGADGGDVVHHGLRRDLGDFVEVAGRTPVGDRFTWRALERRWTLLVWVLHHRGPQVVPGAEAAQLDRLVAACGEGFARLAVTADADARAALVVRLTAARERLAVHLAHEETAAPADRDACAAAAWAALTARRPLRVVPWAMHALPTEAREQVLAQPGGASYRLVWLLTRRRFERRHRRAFRYAAASI